MMAALTVRTAVLSLLAVFSNACECPDKINAVFADMHDGDQKEVTIDGTSVEIKPYGNDQKWHVTSVLNVDSCSASVDFNVPGKPNPPPVNLLMTLWCAAAKFKEGTFEKATFEFSDPSGKLATASTVLNTWVELGASKKQEVPPCPELDKATFADMHDGDKKVISVKNSKMMITSANSSQTWVVKSDLDEFCGAMVNFNVPGKPSPPPVPLAVHFWHLTGSNQGTKNSLEFTDPSGTLAVPGFPLNSWIQMDDVMTA